MKKYESISLIETLISLAIVGISIVALMPVMTVKKTATDPYKGNSFWTQEKSGDDTYTYINVPLAIGTSQEPKTVSPARTSSGEKRPFIVTASGVAHKGIPPLYVSSRLYFRGQEIISNNDELTLSNGKNSLLHLTNNRVSLISNNNDLDFIDNDNSVSLQNSTQTVGSTTYPIDYMRVERDRENIGIGKHALYGAEVEQDTTNGKNIVIANLQYQESGTSDLHDYIGIGAKNGGGNIATDTAFVIHYNGNTDSEKFTINANLKTPEVTLGGLVLTSDKRLKDIIGAYKKGLYEIEKLKPVEFTYKSDEKQVHHIGVIAQDLQKVFPESISKDKDTGYLLINTDAIFYALLNSIKELNEKNKTIEKDNDALEAKIAELRKIRDDLKTKKGGSHE